MWPAGSFTRVHAVGVLDDQFAAVVFVGLGKEQSRGKIGADAVSGCAHLANRVVHMRAERLAALIAVEQRRKHLRRQCRRNEQRILSQGGRG